MCFPQSFGRCHDFVVFEICTGPCLSFFLHICYLRNFAFCLCTPSFNLVALGLFLPLLQVVFFLRLDSSCLFHSNCLFTQCNLTSVIGDEKNAHLWYNLELSELYIFLVVWLAGNLASCPIKCLSSAHPRPVHQRLVSSLFAKHRMNNEYTNTKQIK